MVTPKSLAGFSVLEVVVALALVCTTLFGAMAASAWAARMTQSAEALETALMQADATLDSLLNVPAPVSGTALRHRTTITWHVTQAEAGSRIDLRVDYFDGGAWRTLRLDQGRTAPLLPFIGPKQ
jgi:Tfp pilus assembly protein PilV